MNKILHFTAILLIASCSDLPAFAQHFALDTTFSHTGIDALEGNIASGIIHRPAFVFAQPDNKIVLIGDIYYASSVEVMRLKEDGTFDSTFNDSGKVVATHSYIQTAPSAAVLYDTSKIITASQWLDISTGWEYVSVFNFNSNGTLNSGFGTGGVAMVGFTTSPVYCYPVSCGVQTDGKIVIMGLASVGGLETYGLIRLMPNGSVDGTYGTGGRILDPYLMLDTIVGTSPNAAIPICGLMQSDNKFVVAGRFSDSTDIYNAYQCFIVRHNMDGSPDLTFGDADGITLIKEPNQDYEARAMATDSAGNFYIFAHIERWVPPFADSNFVVIKLDTNGHRVSSYGYNGISFLQLPVANAFSTAFAVQKDGRAIIGNIYHDFTSGFADQFIAYRLDTAGNLDTSFNTGGFVTAQRDTNRHDLSIAAAIQPDGKILLAGYDTLSATGICMRFTNHFNTPLLLAPVAKPIFTSTVSPNPVAGKELHIQYNNGGNPGVGALQLYDVNGRLLDLHHATFLSGAGDISYSLPSVPPGVYYLVLLNNAGEKQTHPITFR